MDKSRANPRHPTNDPAFAARRRPSASNPANNPDFIFEILDRMEDDPKLREQVWQCFYDGTLEFLFHDGQLEALLILEERPTVAIDEVVEFLILCSRQWGKSFFILVIALMHCAKPHGRRRPLVRIFCKTTTQVEEIVNDNMQVILALAPPGWIKRTKSENRWKAGLGEIRLCPMAAAHVHGKRGGNATKIILEEGCVTKSDEYRKAIGAVINPQLLRSEGDMVHVTTPPEDLDHYILTSVLPNCERAGAVARQTVYDNPQLTERQIIAAFERCTDEEEWDREYLVKLVRSMVWTAVPEFVDSIIQPFELPQYHKTWLGGDWGGVRDKNVFLLLAYDFKLAKLLVYDEVAYDRHTPTAVIVASIKAMEARWKLTKLARVVDCPGQLQVDLNADPLKMPVMLPQKDGFEASVNLIRMAIPNMLVHPRCQLLIRTLRHGRTNKQRTDFERNDDLGHCDALMALCYGIRHANKANPFPAFNGASPYTHYINPIDSQNKTATSLKGLFKGPR